MSDQRLLDRFVRLCEIPSPTGAERAVADDVLGELRELGVEVTEDGAAAPARAGAGNLIARVPGRGGGLGDVLLPTSTRSPRRARSRSSSPTASSAAAARRSSAPTTRRRSPSWSSSRRATPRRRRRPGSSWCSRSPRRTACAARRSSTSARCGRAFGFALDHASPIGEVITAAPTYQRLVAEFEGLEAHAGIRPEDGRLGDRGGGRGDRGDAARPARRGDDRERRRDRRAGSPPTSSPGAAGSRPRRARSTSARSPRRRPRWSTPAPGRRASTAATSTST